MDRPRAPDRTEATETEAQAKARGPAPGHRTTPVRPAPAQSLSPSPYDHRLLGIEDLGRTSAITRIDTSAVAGIEEPMPSDLGRSDLYQACG